MYYPCYPQMHVPVINAGPVYGKVNELFQIQLSENPTTGYGWAVALMPQNICLLQSSYTPEPFPSAPLGSGGTRTFIFGGLSPGQGRIKLMYVRPWDLLNPADTAIYDVVINP